MKSKIIYFVVFLILFFFVFRNLLLNISTNLIDWMDYPLILWIMYQSISKILSSNFTGFFDTSAFYPHTNTLFFSDLLLPQAIIATPFFALTKNLILSFNIIFIITFILNYLASYLFWEKLFKNSLLAFIGSIFLVFSPFFHLELSHFQMLSFWPGLFCLYFLFEQEFKPRKLAAAGVFLTVQFLTSAYLSIYIITSILVCYFFKYLSTRKSKEVVLSLGIVFMTFLATCGFFIKGYLDTKKIYSATRDIREYIQYSAHLSDYIFTSHLNSAIHKSSLMQLWNSFDKHFIGVHSSFPGFLFTFLSFIGLFSIVKKSREWVFQLSVTQEKAFFVTMLFLGFIFSLGPRLNFNGSYAHIPLPFLLFLKAIPLFEITRVPARWSFVFFFALIYFSLIGIKKLQGKLNPKLLFTSIFIIFFLEYIPLSIETHAENYIDSSDMALRNICLNGKKVLLEIPVTHLDAAPNVGVGLNYITKVELSSTYHNCYIVNGYSGYDLPELLRFRDQLYLTIQSNDTSAFLSLINEHNIDIVKFNMGFFIEELKIPGRRLIEDLVQLPNVTLLDNTTFLIRD